MGNRIYFISLGIIFLLYSCTKTTEKYGLSDIFNNLSKAKTYNEVKKYYTTDTIGAVNNAADNGLIAEKEKMLLLPIFNNNMKWEKIDEQITGDDRAVIRIKYIEHPVENMIGFEMNYKLVKEKGAWKIDIEREIKEALKGRKKMKASEYLIKK